MSTTNTNSELRAVDAAMTGYACPGCDVALVDAEWSALDQLLNGLLFTGRNIKQCPKCRKKYLPTHSA